MAPAVPLAQARRLLDGKHKVVVSAQWSVDSEEAEGISSWLSTGHWPLATSSLLLLAGPVVFVGPQYLLHQGVAHDVALVEVADGDPVDVAQPVDRVGQPAARLLGQVHL